MNEPPDNHGSTENSRKAAGRPWPRGTSGNPGGRRRKSDADRRIEHMAREASADAFAVVRELMTTANNDRTRLAAALAVIERAHGKPGELLAEPVESTEAATLAERAEAIAAAAMAGTVSVTQASALLACLASVAKVREVEQLAARLEAVEAALKSRTT
ncbi:MAG: hypothetical protein AB9M53_09845 [Leptothrix sp. (in: b-proteobacteria)]